MTAVLAEERTSPPVEADYGRDWSQTGNNGETSTDFTEETAKSEPHHLDTELDRFPPSGSLPFPSSPPAPVIRRSPDRDYRARVRGPALPQLTRTF